MTHRIMLFFLMSFFLNCFSSYSLNKALVEESINYPCLTLNERELCDLEMILVGGFAPLQGFLNEKDYLSVLDHCRLSDGALWPIPIVLSVDKSWINHHKDVAHITLVDDQNNPLAILDVEDIYKPNIDNECLKVFNTLDTNHPYVDILKSKKNPYYIGGQVREIQKPKHFDFNEYRLTPHQVKEKIKTLAWDKVIGFQTRNPLHKSHVALTLECAKKADAKILLQPVIGVTQPQDVDYTTRVRCYKKVLKYYPEDSIMLSLIPLSMRMAGPREALWHALIRKNYGCSHFIVGRDHAGPSNKTQDGHSFYLPYEAQEFVLSFQNELGIDIVPSKEIVYVQETDDYLPIDEVKDNTTFLTLSGTQLRHRLLNNLPIPTWFSYPDIVDELRLSYKKNKGFCVYFTGLSGAGKSTLANALKIKLQSVDPLKRNITVLDGDIIRNNLSKGLGFSKEDRSINVRRIGFVASLIVKNGGICLCANIAPYDKDRKINRSLISEYGPYIEVFVDTPLQVCEQRDAKGLYKLARTGKIKEFTGISDPFELPNPKDVVILDGTKNIEDLVEELLALLKKQTPLD